ncbi:hypothetical protein ACJX0J_017769, partial [Zea mays]
RSDPEAFLINIILLYKFFFFGENITSTVRSKMMKLHPYISLFTLQLIDFFWLKLLLAVVSIAYIILHNFILIRYQMRVEFRFHTGIAYVSTDHAGVYQVGFYQPLEYLTA